MWLQRIFSFVCITTVGTRRYSTVTEHTRGAFFFVVFIS